MTVSDVAHQRMGSRRTYQIGLRLTDDELKLFKAACAHREWNDREWIEHVLLSMASRVEDAKSPDELRALYDAYAAWQAPSPASNFLNCRVFEHAAALFLRALDVLIKPKEKFTPLLRWAVNFEAPQLLATPSKSAMAQARFDAQFAMLQAAKAARATQVNVDVRVPAGAAFVPGFDPHRPVTPQTVIVPEYSRGPQLVQQLAQALAKPSAPRPALFIPAPAAPAPTPAAPLRQLVLPPLPQEAVQTLQHNPPPYAAADEVPAFYRQKGPNDPTVPPMPDFSEEEY